MYLCNLVRQSNGYVSSLGSLNYACVDILKVYPPPDLNDVCIQGDSANTFLNWVLSIVDSMDVFNTQPYPVVGAIQQHISISTHIFLCLLRFLYPSGAPASPGFLFVWGGHPADATRSMPPGRCHPADAIQPCISRVHV